MARTLIVVGDALQAGGSVLTGSPQTDIEGRAVARIGDRVICARHGPGSILTGDATLVIDGQPVARHGDKASCGCALLAGKQQLAHVSAGGARLAAAAAKTVDLIQVPSVKPTTSSLTNTRTPPDQPEQCWLNDHSCQVLEYPDNRYFESYASDGVLLEYDLISSFRIDVPLKSGGDIEVTAKIRIVKRGVVSNADIDVAKERMQLGINQVLNGQFNLKLTDPLCGSRNFPIRYSLEFVSSGEDYVLYLHDVYPREEVKGKGIFVNINTDEWVYAHEFGHCLGLPDEYMDPDQPAPNMISYFLPDGTLSPNVLVTRSSSLPPEPSSTFLFNEYLRGVQPRHAWNIGLEVQELLTKEIGRQFACEISCCSSSL
ncbi:PAAR domain-containing protein [Stenotrophomonas pigmentata]|uniref:PAAR domain-containing protein n=1 Tax=Stenotrophomonas pigmentata TaxID=3055080 RepID=UPI0026F29989|nr:PAAR domain-containing protein [Stenotrophomonas sp. 610A2]